MEAKTNILLTGFTPFGGLTTNPSQQVVEAIARNASLQTRATLYGEVLNTTYATAGQRVRELITELRPDIVLLLGVAAKSTALAVERFALNMDDATKADNAGQTRTGQPIASDGPAAYAATLPVDALCSHLKTQGFQATPSNHAGTFVCNHVLYQALHSTAELGLASRCGFIHVPMPPDEVLAAQPQPQQTLTGLTRAIELSLAYLIDVVATNARPLNP